jgi:RNA recognition motif-containing protein
MKSSLEKFLKFLVVIVFITVASFTSFSSPASATIYVKNLPNDATKSDIESLFKPYGFVEKVTLLTDKKTGEFRGLATVNLPKLDKLVKEVDEKTPNSLILDESLILVNEKKAIENLDGTEWRGHTLIVKAKASELK